MKSCTRNRLCRVITLSLLAILLWPTQRAGAATDEMKSVPDELGVEIKKLPLLPPEHDRHPNADWLITPGVARAGVYRNGANELVLSNGLIRRTFRITPNAATVGLDNLITGQSLLRGVKPAATLKIDDTSYSVGGLIGQPNNAYLLSQWLDDMKVDPSAFQLKSFEVGKIQPRFAWKRVRWSGETTWPPPGASLVLHFTPPPGSPTQVSVDVHYELYDDLPLISKWLSIRNEGDKPIRLQKFTSEILAVIEDGPLAPRGGTEPPVNSIHVESDYAFLGPDAAAANKTAHWVPDPQYETQVNYERATKCLLECRPPIGPDSAIKPGEPFETFRVFELIHDSADRERRGLALRRMYRALAPWVTENPIMMHVVSVDPKVVKAAIDQASEVGFEMVILSFSSGLNMEDTSPATIAKFKELADYARSKNIELGGYSLLASRSIGLDTDVVNPKPAFGASPCLMSQWGNDYFHNLQHFIKDTGFTMLEHDGSYPGDTCASTKHPGHRGIEDSQWNQWRKITDFYKSCRASGIFLNVPDWYFLSGSNKTGMGYRETNWSLPRAQQIIHGRQNIYDGTWEKTPSMGWMFVPLTEYQGGGAAATIEPLKDHLDAYEAHLANNFAAGVQACYRGFRLYDSDATKAVVKKWVDWYKQNREILNSDLIHVRRADGRNIDCMMHVNPRLKTKALAVMFNPADHPLKQTIRLPLRYAGLTDVIQVRRENETAQQLKLDRDYNIDVEVEMQARSITWYTLQ
jgi:hypothetical protein